MSSATDTDGTNKSQADNRDPIASTLFADETTVAARSTSSNSNDPHLPFLVTHWLANYGSSSVPDPPAGRDGTATSTVKTPTEQRSDNYDGNGQQQQQLERGKNERDQALMTIRRATSELASAFATLGAYGTTIRPSFGGFGESSTFFEGPVSTSQNSTYGDMFRQYASRGRLDPDHLGHLTHAASFNSSTARLVAQRQGTVQQRTNLLLRATTPGEMVERKQQNETNMNGSTAGRTVQDAIVLDNAFDNSDNDEDSGTTNNILATSDDRGASSVMFRAALINANTVPHSSATNLTENGLNVNSNNNDLIDGERTSDPLPQMEIQPTQWEVAHQLAESIRDLFDTRNVVRSLSDERRSIEVSLAMQRKELDRLSVGVSGLASKNESPTTSAAEETSPSNDEVTMRKQCCDRVISQLERKLSDLDISSESSKQNLARLQRKVCSLNSACRSVSKQFYDPYGRWKGTVAKGNKVGGNGVLNMVMARQRGFLLTPRQGDSGSGQRNQISMLHGPSRPHFAISRRHLLEARLSHAVTIHAHSKLPVFCMRFDQTGRYFVSGADDYLVKVFYVGADKSCQKRTVRGGSRLPKCNYGANSRGAVLVCTLRGHTKVINDINVSPDNALLATSSEDGDVRVWSMKNGSPIAILRGHTEGANGVSWSPLAPYRLLTNGSDGVTRLWDIREACLKRGASNFGERDDYRLKLTAEEERILKECQNTNKSTSTPTEGEAQSLPPLPPLPPNVASQSSSNSSSLTELVPPPPLPQPAQNSSGTDGDNTIVVPPLPAAVPPLGQGADAGLSAAGSSRNDNSNGRGDFIENDVVDEGVKLISKYQHGSTQEERDQQPGPGTRARRAAVKVMCISHCPLGNQFVTGTDDGICRVWEEFDDTRLDIIDSRPERKKNAALLRLKEKHCRSTVKTMQRDPLLKLMGHLSAITDLSYSNTGDRILSASEKDGVVRLWDVGVSPSMDAAEYFNDRRVTQIVIKLTNPSSESSNGSPQRNRRRPGGSSRGPTSKVYCNCAVWTHDDSKIITSQCVLKKETSNEIQPGSQHLFLWDSKSGICLMGVAGAHQMQCSVVIPHPFDDSIVCSAGGDGKVKLWDWQRGKCIFSHENRAMYPDNVSGEGGYLDGSFSPDGMSIVLGDDAGQISLFDVLSSQRNQSKLAPTWMREQYFADDYYEMEYDVNGHCYDKRSGRPPHLAPKAARCNFGGSAYSEEINDTFKRLTGPSPLPDEECRLKRSTIRNKRSHHNESSRFADLTTKLRVGVREFDSRSTILIRGEAFVDEQATKAKKGQRTQTNDTSTAQSRENRQMSENYRYLDYEDLVRREGEEVEQESEDEDFEPTASRGRTTGRRRSQEGSDDESDADDDSEDDDMSAASGNRSRRRSTTEPVDTQRRERAERRARRQVGDFMELDSEDELVQYCSSNTTPNGVYLRDFNVSNHFWRIKNTDISRIHRKWLHRAESDSSYNGQKTYAPQVGDSVVYIPRAHLETIDDFPSFIPPWQKWPQEAEWPVVRCFVRGCRYRFPFSDYFRSGQVSIVTILTVEVTGIPELATDRTFPWPKPSFVQPANPYVFELSLFENDNCDYLIPETLYTSRLKALEANLMARNGNGHGLQVDMYFNNNSSREDPKMEVWLATIDSIENEDDRQDLHLQGSGYGVVQVSGDDYSDVANPWELNTEGMELSRPSMAEEDKSSVLNALTEICKDDIVAEQLTRPVNIMQYYDYETLVEVPMDVMFIKRRVNSNYYNSKLGVVADLRLVRDNCIKYNTAENDISEAAIQMCANFEEKVLSTDEKAHLIDEEEFDKISREQANGSRSRPSLRIRIPLRNTTASSRSNASTYTLRDRSSRSGSSAARAQSEQLSSPSDSRNTSRSLRSAGPTRRLRSTGTGSANAHASSGRASRTSRSSNPHYRDVENSEEDSDRRSEERTHQRRSRRYPARGASESPNGTRRSSRLQDVAEESNEETDDDDQEDTQEVYIQSRSTRRRISSPRYQEDGRNDEHNDVDEDVRIRDERTRRSTRSTRRRASTPHRQEDMESLEDPTSDEDDNDVQSESSDDNDDVHARRGRSSTRLPATETSPGRSRGRLSRRAAATNSRSYEEVDSDADMEEEEENVESEQESEDGMNSARSSRRQSSRSSRTSRRNSRPPPDSPEESEESEENDSDEDEEAFSAERKRKAVPARGALSKKLKRASGQPLPELVEWPEIGVKEITKVVLEVVKRMGDLDHLQAFSAPVIEFFPEIEDEYLAIVDEPMDLRTIEEERIHTYDSILGLQRDLILMFRNCCTFNEEGEDIWEHSFSLWEQVNQVFLDSCKKLGVLLPRRWSP